MERWRRIDSDLPVGGVLLVLCAAIAPVVVALPSDGVVAGAPGSRLFPLGLLTMLAALSLVLCLGGLRRTLVLGVGTRPTAGRTPFDSVVLRVTFTLATLSTYVYLMSATRGWLRSTGIFLPRGYAFALFTAILLTGFFYIGNRRVARSAMLASTIALVLYVGFVTVLSVRFP